MKSGSFFGTVFRRTRGVPRGNPGDPQCGCRAVCSSNVDNQRRPDMPTLQRNRSMAKLLSRKQQQGDFLHRAMEPRRPNHWRSFMLP